MGFGSFIVSKVKGACLHARDAIVRHGKKVATVATGVTVTIFGSQAQAQETADPLITDMGINFNIGDATNTVNDEAAKMIIAGFVVWSGFFLADVLMRRFQKAGRR